MARRRIPVGDIGNVGTVPLGTGADGQEVVIPLGLADDGSPRTEYPRTIKVGSAVKILTDEGVAEYVVTRWRGLCRAVAHDGQQFMVRRWAPTRAAAEHVTREAARSRVAELKALADQQAQALAAGNVVVTVGDMLDGVMGLPALQERDPRSENKSVGRAPRTREQYARAITYIQGHGAVPRPNTVTGEAFVLADQLPRDVDAAMVGEFMKSFTAKRGTSAATRARAVLNWAFESAAKDRSLKITSNPMVGAGKSIPAGVKVRQGKLDKRRVPADEEVFEFLAALRRDPEALHPLGGGDELSVLAARGRRPGRTPSGDDTADLLAVLFRCGLRIAEAVGLRWADLKVGDNPSLTVSGTVYRRAGEGLVWTPEAKNVHSLRTVAIPSDLAVRLVERAEMLGVALGSDYAVFPQPAWRVDGSGLNRNGHPVGQWRDSTNVAKSIRAAFDRHGLEWASSHTGRRWRLTSLTDDRNIPLRDVAALAGHKDIATLTRSYIARGDATSDAIRSRM